MNPVDGTPRIIMFTFKYRSKLGHERMTFKIYGLVFIGKGKEKNYIYQYIVSTAADFKWLTYKSKMCPKMS